MTIVLAFLGVPEIRAGTLFALHPRPGSSELVTIDPSTGTITPVGGSVSQSIISDTSALDAAGHKYFFVGQLNPPGSYHYFTVDTRTGAVLTTSPPFTAADLSFGVEFDPTAAVSVDIKPGSDHNAINPASKGLIPVAILTTEDFDARTVSPSTVRFGPGGATLAHRSGQLEDVDGDGDLDLVLHFRTQETGIRCGDTKASLTGETFDGLALQGLDSIVTVGCR